MKVKSCIILFFVGIFVFNIKNIFSQEPRQRQFLSEPIGVISGKIVDSQTNNPMEYVSIRLFRFRDSSIVNGALTDKNGYFEIKNIPFGRYYGVIKLIGFKTKIIDSIFITPRNPEVNLGIIHFQAEPFQTKEVEVTAQKDIVSYAIDRRIYDVSKDLSVVGGSALDVLSNVPSVSVDIEGNISLRGSGNVQILIDGKPSSLLGFDRGTALDQIPADNIERIEVITNPSAKYDPDGVAGIINIILKKNLMLGYGAIINANIGTADKYNGSLNLNLRTENFNSTIGYNYRRFSMRGNTKAERNSFAPDSSYLLQNQSFLRRGNYHRFQFSSEWFPNSKNSLIFNVNAGLFGRDMTDSTGYNFSTFNSNFLNYDNYFRKNKSEGDNFSYDLSLFYKYLFDKKDKEINSNFMFLSFKGDDNNFYDEFHTDTLNILSASTKQNNKTNSLNNNLNFEINYIDPLEFGKIETGIKANIRTIDIDYSFFNFDYLSNQWLINDTLSNRFGYDENIISAYLTFGNRIGKFGFQIGLRAEQTFTISEQKTLNETYRNKYFNLFPTVHLNYQLTPSNSLMFSYTRRINRPQSMYLNPFVDYSDPQNLSQGNPYLKPEFANAFEISNLTYFGRNSLNLTLFYRYTTDIISRITRLEQGRTYTITTYENLNQSKSLGFEAMLNQSIFDFWKLNLNFSYFYLDVNGIPQFGIPGRNSKSWNLKLNSVWNITKNIDVQFNLSYDSPVVTTGGGGRQWRFFEMGSVGKLDGIFTANISFKIDILNERGTINFRLMDMFKTINYNLTTNGSNFVSHFYRIRESRVAFLGFQYKINEYKRPKAKRPEEIQEIEFE
ncbi:MAG: TonB-dependent receptor family protein [Ignavibacteria bacterium]|nr:TonB-dependent receptor family protein [Ignavibacteria bacterium]